MNCQTLQDFYLRESLVVDPEIGERPSNIDSNDSKANGMKNASPYGTRQNILTVVQNEVSNAPYHLFPDKKTANNNVRESDAIEMGVWSPPTGTPIQNESSNPLFERTQL
jgi:hypothetical protein